MISKHHKEHPNSPAFFQLIEHSSDLIVVTDLKGNFIKVNDSVYSILGYTSEEVVERSYTEFLHPDYQEVSDLARRDILEGKQLRTFDNIYFHKDGREVYFNWSACLSETGTLIFAIGRDMTERKLEELANQESSSKYKSLFDQSSDSIMITDFKGNFIDVNSSLCGIFGYERHELLSMNIRDLVDHEEVEARPIAFDRLKNGEHLFNERTMIKRDGSRILVEANVKKLNEGAVVAIAKDISAIKKVNQEKKEAEELLKLFVEHSPAALAMFDTNMNYILTSKRWLTDYNLQIEDIKGLNHYEVFKEIPQRWKDIHQDCLKGNIARNNEDNFIDNNGKLQWNKWEIHPWYKTNGEIGGIIMFTEVITKIKEAEKKFKDLVENPLVGVFILQDHRLAYVNSAIASTLGYSCAELTNTVTMESLVLKEDLNVFSEMMRRRFSDAADNFHFEFRGRHKQGHAVWIEIFANITVYNSNPAIIGTMVDISQRKKSEEESQKVSLMLIERIKELTTLYKVGQILQDKSFSIDEQLEQIIHVMPDGWQYPEITAARIEFSGNVYKTKNYKDSEHSQIKTFETSDGRLGIVEVSYLETKPLMDEGPFMTEERNLINMIAEMLQIYINRTLEAEALLKSEANLKSIFQNTESIYVLTDNNLQIMSYNSAALKFVSDELGILDPKNIALKDYFREDRSETIKLTIDQVLKGKEVNYEADYRRGDGKGNWYQVRLNPIMNEGKFMGLLIALNNITDRKLRDEHNENQIRLLKELSYIISHELRHEYIKLHGVVNLLSQTEHVDMELQEVLQESKNTFQNLNESIFKLNDKINSFNAETFV